MGIFHKPKKYKHKSKYKHITIYDDLKNSSNPFALDKNSLSYKDRQQASKKVVKPKGKKKPDKDIPVKKHTKFTSSLGEKRIENYLNKNLIWFEREKEMNGMTNVTGNANLRFDFYLPMHRIAIEFDGIQHFKKSKYDTKTNTLERRQLNDSCKDGYCASKKIKMIRIPYNDYSNIESILSKLIPDLTKIKQL